MTVKTVLVTGCFGYVGSRLVPLLIESGYTVRGIDLCLYGDAGYTALSQEQRTSLTFHKGDIRDPSLAKQAVSGADAVIHLAAISNDPTGEIDDTLTRQVNFDAVGMLVLLAKKAGVSRFINASSSSVFGVKTENRITEKLEPEPITSYSRYKMLSEWVVKAAATDHFCTVNIRPATICGPSPRQRFDLTVNKLTADAVRKKLITIHGGSQRRPNIGITDMIHLYRHLLTVDNHLINGRTFNFGFENLQIFEIAELIQRELNDPAIKMKVTNTLDKRDYHICSDEIVERLRYEVKSSIAKEVAELRAKLETGSYPDIDSDRYHNMKSMKLSRMSGIYNDFFATE